VAPGASELAARLAPGVLLGEPAGLRRLSLELSPFRTCFGRAGCWRLISTSALTACWVLDVRVGSRLLTACCSPCTRCPTAPAGFDPVKRGRDGFERLSRRRNAKCAEGMVEEELKSGL